MWTKRAQLFTIFVAIAQIHAWLTANVVDPLAAEGVRIRFALLRFDNVLRKPGPAVRMLFFCQTQVCVDLDERSYVDAQFNFMMACAWQDGSDYLYRINDDTQFVGTGWPQVRTKAPAALQSGGPHR